MLVDEKRKESLNYSKVILILMDLVLFALGFIALVESSYVHAGLLLFASALLYWLAKRANIKDLALGVIVFVGVQLTLLLL